MPRRLAAIAAVALSEICLTHTAQGPHWLASPKMASVPTPSGSSDSGGSSDSNGAPATPAGTPIPDEARELDFIEAGLDELERALERLDDGSYWKCEECGEPLDRALLEEDPTTRRCCSYPS
jgi:hypothetical protein